MNGKGGGNESRAQIAAKIPRAVWFDGAEHHAKLTDVVALVGTKTHGGRVTPIRRLRHRLDCSCGVTLGVALDYIDAKKAWRAHVGT